MKEMFVMYSLKNIIIPLVGGHKGFFIDQIALGEVIERVGLSNADCI